LRVLTHPLDPATVDRRTLSNGLTALVRVDRSAPVVAIVTHLNVGYFDEPDELAGISHVLEHMFFKGTPARGPGRIAQETKGAGGYLNAATIYDHTSYYTVLPARSLADGIAIQADALLHSVLDADELHRELQVIIQEARRKLDNPGAVALESLYALMYDQHRIRRWRIGAESFLQNLTRDQLHRYYRDYYGGGRTIVVVAGDVDADHAHRLIERHYGALAPDTLPVQRGPAEPEHTEFRFREQPGNIVQSHLELGWRTTRPLHEQRAALDVLGVILGQGRASRLYRCVREAGLVHAINARHYTPTELGQFEISVELKPADTLPALKAIVGTVESAAHGLDNDEVERARNVIEARTVRQLESMEGQATHLAGWQALGDWRLAQTYLESVARVAVLDVQQVARQYLTLPRASVFLYHPEDARPLGYSSIELARQLTTVTTAVAPIVAPTGGTGRAPNRVVREQVEDGVHFFRTAAGVPIVIKPRPTSPLVSLAIALRGGTSLEAPAQAGLSALAARTSIKGTRTRTAAQLALAAEALGAVIQPGVGADSIDWSMSVPSRHFEAALDLLLDAALQPVFDEDETEKEKRIALAELEEVRDDMYRFPLRLFLSAAFPGHAYGWPLETTESAIRNASAHDLRVWHRRTTLEATPTIFMVGAVEPERAAAAVPSSIGRSQNGFVKLATPVWPAARTQVTAQRPKAQTALVLGFPGVKHEHPDALVLQVLANAIAGLGGRLFEELRSRRALAYAVSAHPVARGLGGAFVSYIATAPEREDEARQGLLEQLGHVRVELLSESEVERARQYTIGTWQIRSQTNAAQLGELMHALLVGRGLSELREFPERVQAMTPTQLRDAAQRYFDETRLVEAVVRGTGSSR
jgi:zinc protease